MFYIGVCSNADEAIKLFKEQRMTKGALKRQRDQNCVKDFCHFLITKRNLIYPNEQKISDLDTFFNQDVTPQFA